jgi:Vacuolar protein sorting-associated protein 62
MLPALIASITLLGGSAPVVIPAGGERDGLTSVEGGAPTVYERLAPSRSGGSWHQFWLYFAYNRQDRGVLRTGRHEGDWEMVQYRVDGGGVTEAVYAQHSGAERCGVADLETRGGRPVVYLARGSHAAYFHAGTRDRTWPDPNDEADGRGAPIAPEVVRVTASSPAWMRRAGRWGATRAGWVPGEMDSPRGPAFQPQGRWSDPDGWAARARPCTHRDCTTLGTCDGPERRNAGLGAGAIALAVAAVAAGAWRRRPRRRR